jgi:hypothetical protein
VKSATLERKIAKWLKMEHQKQVLRYAQDDIKIVLLREAKLKDLIILLIY